MQYIPSKQLSSLLKTLNKQLIGYQYRWPESVPSNNQSFYLANNDALSSLLTIIPQFETNSYWRIPYTYFNNRILYGETDTSNGVYNIKLLTANNSTHDRVILEDISIPLTNFHNSDHVFLVNMTAPFIFACITSESFYILIFNNKQQLLDGIPSAEYNLGASYNPSLVTYLSSIIYQPQHQRIVGLYVGTSARTYVFKIDLSHLGFPTTDQLNNDPDFNFSGGTISMTPYQIGGSDVQLWIGDNHALLATTSSGRYMYNLDTMSLVWSLSGHVPSTVIINAFEEDNYIEPRLIGTYGANTYCGYIHDLTTTTYAKILSYTTILKIKDRLLALRVVHSDTGNSKVTFSYVTWDDIYTNAEEKIVKNVDMELDITWMRNYGLDATTIGHVVAVSRHKDPTENIYSYHQLQMPFSKPITLNFYDATSTNILISWDLTVFAPTYEQIFISSDNANTITFDPATSQLQS